MIEIKCQNCGQTAKVKSCSIKMGNGKYCSKKCYHDSTAKALTLQCEVCKKSFKRKPSEISKRHFCSKKCFNTTKNGPSVVERNCENCYQVFFAKLSEVNRGSGKVCSRKCQGELQRSRTKIKFEGYTKTTCGYDYSKTTFITAKSKVIITCIKHGDFPQSPTQHMRGEGCPLCANDIISEKLKGQRINHGEFIERIRIKHGDTYDLSECIFRGHNTKITLICKTHGRFKISPHGMTGCQKCHFESIGRKLSLGKEEFVTRARELHGDLYDYSAVEYISMMKPVNIICRVHGVFLQRPIVHLNDSGCSRCGKRVSKNGTRWLDYLKVPLREYRINLKNGKSLLADGYDPSSETIYQFHGDFWHGNPKIYNPSAFNVRSKKTFGELYQTTIEKDALIRNSVAPSGKYYNLITIWESDWNKFIKLNPI